MFPISINSRRNIVQARVAQLHHLGNTPLEHVCCQRLCLFLLSFGGAHPIDTIETNVWYLAQIIQVRTRIEEMRVLLYSH